MRSNEIITKTRPEALPTRKGEETCLFLDRTTASGTLGFSYCLASPSSLLQGTVPRPQHVSERLHMQSLSLSLVKVRLRQGETLTPGAFRICRGIEREVRRKARLVCAGPLPRATDVCEPHTDKASAGTGLVESCAESPLGPLDRGGKTI